MTLSEAIRLGAMLHPQTFNRKFDAVNGVVTATCALGAAEKAGYPFLDTLSGAVTNCPMCSGFAPFHRIIAHLNDDHRLTREAIADWVASIEVADESPAAADAVAGAEVVTLKPTIRV